MRPTRAGRVGVSAPGQAPCGLLPPCAVPRGCGCCGLIAQDEGPGCQAELVYVRTVLCLPLYTWAGCRAHNRTKPRAGSGLLRGAAARHDADRRGSDSHSICVWTNACACLPQYHSIRSGKSRTLPTIRGAPPAFKLECEAVVKHCKYKCWGLARDDQSRMLQVQLWSHGRSARNNKQPLSCCCGRPPAAEGQVRGSCRARLVRVVTAFG